MDAREIIALLGLHPHPEEGGWYVETWRDRTAIAPQPGVASRELGTAIYYLLTADAISAMHRLPRDELFHFYAGDPVEMLLLHPGGTHELRTLGADLRAGHRPQIVVPGGVWQGSLLAPGGRWALIGTTMSPAFAFADYTHGDVEALAAAWPDAATPIHARRSRA